ncbi:type II toxin-antitoxin system HicA family toxin [Candidatus Gottesmanbacteria bacterium]|nr:type II toxin-antitoxin system HicA family toxin [Candidatus Gottesmanbacteria bacterium]
MPNIPTLTARKLIKVLKKKGFVLHRIHGSHHIFMRQTDQTTVSVPAHAGHDLGRGLMIRILKDAGITREELPQLL